MGLKPRASAAKTPSRDELARWLQTPPLIRAVFWCSFDCDAGTNEELLARLIGLADISWRIVDSQSPPTGKRFFITGSPPYRRVGWEFRRKRARWQLCATFREMGTYWGSNQAEWQRFKSIALPHLGARDVIEETR